MKRTQLGRSRTQKSGGGRWKLVGALAAVVGVALSVLFALSQRPTYVMQINAEPVDLREYQLIFNRHRSQVYNL